MISFAQRPANRGKAPFVYFQKSVAQKGKKLQIKILCFNFTIDCTATEGIVQIYFPTTGKKYGSKRVFLA